MLKSRFISVIILLFLVSPGCKKDRIDKAGTVDFIWAYSRNHPEGFTLDILTRQEVTHGIVADYFETQNSFGKEKLSFVVEHALNHEAVIGGWLNAADSLYYFDSSKVFPDGAITEAIEFARENHQYAIYDITNDSVIWVVNPRPFESDLHFRDGWVSDTTLYLKRFVSYSQSMH